MIELTDRFCRTAKPASNRRSEYFDTSTKGLSLIASAGGTRTFYLHYTRPSDGKRQRLKLGTYPEMPLANAREKAREGRSCIIDGRDPLAEKRAHAASQTVSDLVNNYLFRQATTKRSGSEIARRLRKNVSDVIGSVKLADLHRRDLTRCIDAIKDRGADTEANRVFEDMRAMVRWARGRGDLDDNLVDGMRRPSETRERDRYLTADEIRSMWNALPEADMRESTRRILRLCLVTGQRVGEIAGMSREEIDLDTAAWTIPPERVKNGREHVVPLSNMAVAILRDQIEDVETLAKRKDRTVPHWVFPGPGSRAAVTSASMPKAVKRLEMDGAILRIKPWIPHDLRRTAATHMEGIGISPHIVGHVLNHVSVTKASVTSRVYARYSYDREKREALERWAERLESIIYGDVLEVRPFGKVA